jgi:hypothetical protein
MLFSLRLDETNTHDPQGFFTVGGAVASIPQWEKLERAWSQKIAPTGLDYFHLKDFDARVLPYKSWSKFKANRFEEALHKIIHRNTAFRCVVSIEGRVHRRIKERMRGISGFRGDSDYGLALRYLLFWTCEELCKLDPDARLAVIVEDGPWASGAMTTYQKVAAMQGKWKPAKHAHRLAGFGSQPKGVMRSLEAADLIVGREHRRLVEGTRASSNDTVLSALLDEPKLESWYEGMMREKELRREFGARGLGR